MIGLGDLGTVFEKFNDVISKDKQKEMAKKISSGSFTLRDMYAINIESEHHLLLLTRFFLKVRTITVYNANGSHRTNHGCHTRLISFLKSNTQRQKRGRERQV